MAGQATCASLLGSVLLAFSYAPSQAATPVARTMLPISIIDNRPFVDVRVDGHGPFSFLLDTGSSSSTVSAALATSLHLSAMHAGTGSGAGEQTVRFQTVRVATMTVGDFSFGPLDVPAFDTAELSRVTGFEHFDGVLGAEIFEQRVVTIDAARGQLSLVAPSGFKPAVGAVAVPFALDENEMPIVTASVSGVAGSFQVDTGDRSGLTLFGPFWRAHDLDRAIAPTVTAMTGYGIGGPILGIVGRPSTFLLGGFSIPHPVVRLSLQKSGSFTVKNRAGSIGMSILKRFEVSFDYPHHTMWLARGPGFDAPDPYDKGGMWLGLAQQDGLDVVAVTSGSPAAEAGLMEGDLLTKIGGLPAGPKTLFEIRKLLQAPGNNRLAVRAVRNGSRYETRLNTRDQIAPP